jgi:hypothetical protein
VCSHVVFSFVYEMFVVLYLIDLSAVVCVSIAVRFSFEVVACVFSDSGLRRELKMGEGNKKLPL